MMRVLQAGRSAIWFAVSVSGLASILLVVFLIRVSHSGSQKRLVAIPVVSTCAELAPGVKVKRIGAKAGDRYMLQFDVPLDEFKITDREGMTDAPPFTAVYGFSVKPSDSESFLGILYGPLQDDPVFTRAIKLSSYAEKRTILDDKGHFVGDDEWGYLKIGKHWRRTRFQGWVEFRYDSASEHDATNFDRIINSACLP